MNERFCHVISQSHIDMAWLWRWEETIGFIRDTFEAAVDLLERHADATFCQSQLFAYTVTQERFPELFERIRRLIAEGRWEVVGGELVESDHVISGGEALVRQLLYGQLYARRELGTQATVGWSPDTFGHNGNLPQILSKAGIESFVYKRPLVGEQDVPVTPFWWRGIDGSRVLAYRTTNKGWDFVNPIPPDIASRHNLRQTWGYSGTGDRGGMRPYKELGDDEHGRHIYSTPRRFFDVVRAEATDLPLVESELNFTYEGTYTTHSEAKSAHRHCEGLLYLAESLATAAFLAGVPYPHEDLREAWRILSFNAFHDILPGTSIMEVYEDAERDYTRVEELAQRVIERSAEPFVEFGGDQAVIYNPLSQAFEDGTVIAGRVRCDGLTLDNGILRVSVDPETGWIARVTDLRTNREVLAPPGGNVLTLWREDSFESVNAAEWNAWDIGVSGKSEPAKLASPPVLDSHRGAITTRHVWGSSSFNSTISLRPGADWVDVRLDCDWRETLVLLRTEFALNLSPDAEAWHEIAYGAVQRPKDGAEVPSLRWVDISQPDRGAALINDSRCGHSVLGNTLRMTLLRCATNPDPISDQGQFAFVYRLYPHPGNWRDSQVVRRAYELNVPVGEFSGRIKAQPTSPRVEGDGVALGACKVSEDGNSVVLRLYEPHGRPVRARLIAGDSFDAAWEANLLEDAERELPLVDGAVELQFGPFELKTVMLRPVKQIPRLRSE